MSAPTPAAETVARTLAAYPGGITARQLAAAAQIGASTAAKVLAAMETDGTATRNPGPTNGTGRTADIWCPVTTDTATTADQEIPMTADIMTTDGAVTADTDSATNEAGDNGAGSAMAEAPVSAVPVSGAPVSGAPSGSADHFKIVMVAGILGGYPDGISAADVTDQSGLRAPIVARLLTAMEVAGAAVRKPGGSDDAPELWVRGEADLSTVDLANAAPYRECVCSCGHTHRVRTGATVTTRRTGRATGEINTDGSPRMGKNGLRNQVEAFIRDLGAGHEVTPGTVGRELGGRSSGACLNALARLAVAGVVVLTSEAPVKYALADNAPAPSAEVAALMTRPLIGEDDAPATGSDDAPATATDDAAGDATDSGALAA
ncbi:MarR family transcriptional regulator [Krasilnikovia sp. MM14-A1259]|uniref:MarR family transcriptional regulator n=1 Tax=Krasilnikovia sp. MM14-A1259 TaxID=3373539 RepID=UPI003802148E